MNSINTTLAQIAVDKPAATRIFMRHGLDFCCHGQRSLDDACAEKGIDPRRISAELEAVAPANRDEVRLPDRPLDELVEFILKHFHEPLRRDLPALVELARKVERTHADKPGCPRGITEHLERVASEVESHLEKEEQILFPAIQAGLHAMTFMPIKVMMQEHEDHGASLRRTRELTSDLVAPPEACASWRSLYEWLAQLEADLMEHIHLENNVLFPRTLEGGERDLASATSAERTRQGCLERAGQ